MKRARCSTIGQQVMAQRRSSRIAGVNREGFVANLAAFRTVAYDALELKPLTKPLALGTARAMRHSLAWPV